jgi:NTP pyrophosphatase (non-canonical NTP hydrolase)
MKEIEIINHYGYRHQIRKLAEEQYELIEALFEEDEDDITEEIADCLLLINQFKAYYEIKDKDIQKVYDYKIARQERRIADEVQPKL